MNINVHFLCVLMFMKYLYKQRGRTLIQRLIFVVFYERFSGHKMSGSDSPQMQYHFMLQLCFLIGCGQESSLPWVCVSDDAQPKSVHIELFI